MCTLTMPKTVSTPAAFRDCTMALPPVISGIVPLLAPPAPGHGSFLVLVFGSGRRHRHHGAVVAAGGHDAAPLVAYDDLEVVPPSADLRQGRGRVQRSRGVPRLNPRRLDAGAHRLLTRLH